MRNSLARVTPSTRDGGLPTQGVSLQRCQAELLGSRVLEELGTAWRQGE